MTRRLAQVTGMISMLAVVGCGVTAQSAPVPLISTANPPVLIPTVTTLAGPTPTPRPPEASSPTRLHPRRPGPVEPDALLPD